MSFFFFNDTATTEIYTLSLHDALPISNIPRHAIWRPGMTWDKVGHLDPNIRHAMSEGASNPEARLKHIDRKSTRLNSSHVEISYAVFCLKKKKNNKHILHLYHIKLCKQ